MIRLVNREPLDTSSYPAKAGYPVRRGLSVQSSTSLEYWVARSSRAMTAEILISNSRNDRHCEERSDEAIHSFFAPRYGLLRSARNDVDRGNDVRIHLRILAARCVRGLPGNPALKREGAGNTGRSLRPQPCAQNKKAHKCRHHGYSRETPGIPRTMVLTLLRALPGDQGFVDTVTGGIGVSGPTGPTSPPAGLTPTLRRQDHTTSLVRFCTARQGRIHVHRIPPHVS
jgi:hypothetical protein